MAYSSVFTIVPSVMVCKINDLIVSCWTLSSRRMTASPMHWTKPKMGGFSLAFVALQVLFVPVEAAFDGCAALAARAAHAF